MSEPRVQVIAAPIFTRFLKHLAKKYRNIRKDIEPLIDQLEGGETPGDQVKGVKHTVYKVRVKNSDVPKGKSGGYRVIYYIKAAGKIILIAIYAKTEVADLQAEDIRRLVEDFEDDQL
jgi:mRNA-degrading endonuclease RelE of RelBE toxin-antitoxin system